MAEESTKKRKAEDDTLSEYLDSAVEIARQAGEIIKKGFEKCKHVEHKELAGLVTETHKACADLIFDYLKLLYPNHKFIGKETAASCDTTELTDEDTLTWVIDPLGGTSNFMHGYPFVCVSIGLTIGAWPGSWPTVGVVYNPILDELFTGIRGKGAFLNGNPIRVAKQTELMSALVATEVGTKRDKLTVDACTKRVNNSLFEVRSLRMSGSCALNLCGVACGRLDAYYEVGFGGPWDVAAAAIILREAGGIIFDTSSEDFDITFQDIVTSNSSLIVPLLGVLRETK